MLNISNYLKLMRLDRPVGVILLMWPVLWGLWVASGGFPATDVLLIFVVGVFVTRSMGCVINDIADRKFDPHVERTQHRPLAAGTISLKEALILLGVLAAAALFLVTRLNALTVLLACIAAALIAIYPFVKRVVHWPQFVLGIVFGGFPVLMAFSAVQNHLPLVAWLLALASCCWTIAYDTMYAMSDKEDDAKIGVKSTAFLFGKYVVFWIVIFQLIMLLLLVTVAHLLKLDSMFYLGLLLSAALFVYQLILIKNYHRQHCLNAFLNNKWVGALILLGFVFGMG
jgi:4-hydroxybenzoate polyprenyltransferase